MTGFANLFQTGIMHFLGGTVDQVRGAISSLAGMRSEGGKNLAGAGNQFAGLVGSIVPGMSGVMNTTVANTHATSAGVSLVEQAGVSKVSNIGSVQLTKVGKKQVVEVGEERDVIVGKKKLINVGEELTVVVGKSVLHMKRDGTIQLKGVKVLIEGTEHIQHASEMIDMN
jgi:type VI secretion system secreted protein VgrG